MADIRISVEDVRNDNYMLPLLISRLDNCRREIAVAKWRVSSDILCANQIKDSLINIQHDIEDTKEEIEQLYHITNECMEQCEKIENILFVRANDFK